MSYHPWHHEQHPTHRYRGPWHVDDETQAAFVVAVVPMNDPGRCWLGSPGAPSTALQMSVSAASPCGDPEKKMLMPKKAFDDMIKQLIDKNELGPYITHVVKFSEASPNLAPLGPTVDDAVQNDVKNLHEDTIFKV